MSSSIHDHMMKTMYYKNTKYNDAMVEVEPTDL